MRYPFDDKLGARQRRDPNIMRHAPTLGWHTQLRHGAHLFCIIAACVTARNIANQQVLDNLGPQILGRLYIAVAALAGVSISTLGWWLREFDIRRTTTVIHAATACCMVASFAVPNLAWLNVAQYIVMELSFAALLLGFGTTLGATFGPRETRAIAARVGVGGILGGLTAGAILHLGAPLLGSSKLYLVGATIISLPIVWLHKNRTATKGGAKRSRSPDGERSEVPTLPNYGRWVGITTLMMVASTTMIDYQFRYIAATTFDADEMTAFFGLVVFLAGVAAIVFQMTLLDRSLGRLGLFATAAIAPMALLTGLLGLAMLPSLATLAALKIADSGANMSLQQATGSLLLAPLGPRARSVWQGRVDGLARRGGQALTGALLAFLPWDPERILPLTVLLCVCWLYSLAVTRTRYVRLLTDILVSPRSEKHETAALDSATLRLLEHELSAASPSRGAVILELFENVDQQAPAHLLRQFVDNDPSGGGALRVVEHLANMGDDRALMPFVASRHDEVACAALIALADLNLPKASEVSRALLASEDRSRGVYALAAGILAPSYADALVLCRSLVRAPDRRTRLLATQALSRSSGVLHPSIAQLLYDLAQDPDPDIARMALAAVPRLNSPDSCKVALDALHRRELRGAARRALGAMGHDVAEILAAKLNAHLYQPDIAAALAWAIGHANGPIGISALTDALSAPVVHVRLGAATALYAIDRRNAGTTFPQERIAAHYLPEIAYYARMREAFLATRPLNASARLLASTLRDRGHASLETLFRIMSLCYHHDSMQGAFQALHSNDRNKRQIALDLLETLLEPELGNALAEAVEGRSKKQISDSDGETALLALCGDPDPFLASVARAVLSSHSDHSTPGGTMNPTLVDQILELQAVTLFSQSSADDLADVATLLMPRKVPQSSVLFHQGDAADNLYLVRAGAVQLTHNGAYVDEISPGEACGIIAVLDQMPREMTATVTADASLLAIRGDDFLQLLADRPLLMHSVFRAFTLIIRDQIGRVSVGKRAEHEWAW